jgi:uncharacterized membrane protein YphA (DoxX/SURF4 family)
MGANSNGSGWATTAVLVARLIFAALFIMAVSFKLVDIDATAGQIAAAGFPHGGTSVRGRTWTGPVADVAAPRRVGNLR